MSERGPEPPPPGDDGDDVAPEEQPEAPPPATYAGRRGQSVPEEPAEEPSADDEAEAPGAAGEADEEEGPPEEEVPEEVSEWLPAAEGTGEQEEPAEPEAPAEEAEAEPSDEGSEADEQPAAGRSGETVEVDTLAMSDDEAAQEAALTGLRERTATETVKRQAAATAATPEAPPAPPAQAGAPPRQPPPVDLGEGPSSRGVWARFAAASFLIIVSMATATAVSLLVYVTDFAEALRPIPGVQKHLSQIEGGDPETILILGSDKRAGLGEEHGRSDTTILLRIDPDQDAIRLLSIPRDLKVNIPGLGVDKLNAAYSYGGPKLTLQTVKNLMGIDINHIVNVDFNGFANAVNAIECVYIDADHRYYIPPESGISAIDIYPGYQRMCGYKALQYVRFRHTDNDIVRAARQQDFLREARQQVPTGNLINPFAGERRELIDIFTKYTSSDLSDDESTLIDMVKLFLEARNAEVTQLHFPADLGGTSGYVYATQRDVEEIVTEFLGQDEEPSPESRAEPKEPKPEPKKPKPDKPTPPPAPPPMTDVSAEAAQLAATIYDDKLTRFGLLYPTKVVPGSVLEDDSRAFPIDGPGDDVYRGYKLVVSRPYQGYYEYYGVSGTSWKDPPILENPSETREFNGRDYLLFYDSGRLRLVGWKTDDGAYWVTNTLLQTVGIGQMLAIAQSVREFKP